MKWPAYLSVLMCVSSLGLSGCAMLPAQFPQDQDYPVADRWVAVDGATVDMALESTERWWARWDNEELLRLVEATLENNTDVQVALANLRSAQANILSANASLWPKASIGADASRRRSDNRTSESYSADASASWSFSFGGRDLLNRRVALLNAQATELLLQDTKNAMAAEVASSYVRLCLAKQKLMIAQKSLTSFEEAKKLTQWRYQAGLVEMTDVVQAIAQFESSLASLASYKHSILEYQTALSRLTLLPLIEIQKLSTDSLPVPPEGIAVAIPAKVLESRPDVLAAKQSVVEAMEKIRVARADYFPTLSLSGSIGTAAATLGALGASGTGVSALIAALSMPVLNWGDTIAATEIQRANLDKVMAQYRQTVVKALEETENALSAMRTSESRKKALAQATRNSEIAAQLALQQYSSGLSDYQTVLSTQRSLLNAQETEVNNRADWAIAHIDLYRTLGGGWKSQSSTTGEIE